MNAYPTPEMIEAGCEVLYGHPRHKAQEWAKEEKFESWAHTAADVFIAMRKEELTPAEIQSGYNRLQFAEDLIRQLPEDHEGRNTWLLNYAEGANPPEVPDGPDDIVNPQSKVRKGE